MEIALQGYVLWSRHWRWQNRASLGKNSNICSRREWNLRLARENKSVSISHNMRGQKCNLLTVPAGSPPRGGDVTVYVKDKNQSSLPTPFCSVLASTSVFMALSTVFLSISSPDNSVFSLCSSGLISALLVPSTIYLLWKSLSAPI